jgi:hypothetical protein
LQSAGARLGERHDRGALRVATKNIHGTPDDPQVHLADDLWVSLGGIQQRATPQHHGADRLIRHRVETQVP